MSPGRAHSAVPGASNTHRF